MNQNYTTPLKKTEEINNQLNDTSLYNEKSPELQTQEYKNKLLEEGEDEAINQDDIINSKHYKKISYKSKSINHNH